MAYVSYPNDAHNDRAITLPEHEQLLGITAPSGLIYVGGPGPVYADSTGRQVKIRAGVGAWIRGTRFINETETVVSLGANTSGSTRIDLLVLRLDRSTYQITPTVIAGTGAGEPSPVRDETVDGTGVYDIPLAAVTVPNGAITTTASQVAVRAWYMTGEGHIICTPGSRPPHYPGRRIRETNLGRTLESTGDEWKIVLEDSGWVNIPPASGWQSLTHAHARRYNGTTTFEVNYRRTGGNLAAGTNSTMGRLPVGFRPEENTYFTAYYDGANLIRGFATPEGVVVLDNYQVTVGPGGTISGSGTITYPSTL